MVIAPQETPTKEELVVRPQSSTSDSQEHRTIPLHRRSWDLGLLAVLTLLLPVLVATNIPVLRVPIGLAMILLAPGYALASALFVRPDDLDAPGRAGMSFGLSVAVLPVLALVLNQLPWGIRPWPMIISIVVWIVPLCGIAALRRHRLRLVAVAADPVPVGPTRRVADWWHDTPKRVRIGSLLAVIAFSGLLIVGGFTIFSPSPIRLTEFYALGAEGLAEDYPREVAPGETMQVRFGTTNREGNSQSYRIEVRSAGNALASTGAFTIADGGTQEFPLSYALPVAGANQQIDVLLFLGDSQVPYRQLRLWVNVRPDKP